MWGKEPPIIGGGRRLNLTDQKPGAVHHKRAVRGGPEEVPPKDAGRKGKLRLQGRTEDPTVSIQINLEEKMIPPRRHRSTAIGS